MLFFDGEGLSHCEKWVSDIKDDSGEEGRNGSSSLLVPSRLLSARSKDGGEMAKRIKRSRKREELSTAGNAGENVFMTHGTIKEDDEVIEGSRTGLGKGREKISSPLQQPLSKRKNKKRNDNQSISAGSSFYPGRKHQEKAPIEAPAVADYVQGPMLEKSKQLHKSEKKKNKKRRKKKRTHETQNEPTL